MFCYNFGKKTHYFNNFKHLNDSIIWCSCFIFISLVVLCFYNVTEISSVLKESGHEPVHKMVKPNINGQHLNRDSNEAAINGKLYRL